MTTLTANKMDPVMYLDAVDAQWNAHNLDGAIDFFVDDATARFVPPIPGAPDPAVGKEQIRGVIQPLLPGFHVQSRDHRLQGDRLTWSATAAADLFRQMGIDSVDADGEIILAGDRIKRFTITFTPETVANLQAAAQGR